MFKRKKNVTEVSQEQKLVISLPSDVWSDILHYFSRAELCRQIYMVNRQLYNLANSRHIVPTTHVIDQMFFQTADRRRTFFNVFKSKEYNRVRFGDYGSKELETHQLRKMPIPEPFVRIRKVYIFRLLRESILKFLRDAKESFVGSVIHYSMSDILDNKDMRNQMHYLFQNVFQKPSHISVNGSWSRLAELKAWTDGLPNCSRIKLRTWLPATCNEDTTILLDWLSSDKTVLQKHLELDRFPRRFILDLVQKIKDAFIDKRLMLSDFVITFVASEESDYCLETSDRTFIINITSSNERLSFLTHNACRDPRHAHVYRERVYRLWCRRVVNESEDFKLASRLQNLSHLFDHGIDLYDREFYDFSYPYTFH